MGREAERAGLRVLLVGQGPPVTGGIPTFVGMLLTDPWLAGRVLFDYLNTTRPAKRPGAFTTANLRSTLSDASAIFRRGRRADVVHLNLAPAPTLPLLRALVLAVAAKASRSRVILHAHTGRLPLAGRSSLYRVLLRVMLVLVDAFVVVSEPAAEAAGKLGSSVIRLDNGIDPDLFPTGPKAEDPARLVFVGTVCERKGLLDLRDALVRLGEAPLEVEIIGDGAQEGPGAFEGIEAAFAEAGLANARFLGALDHERVRERLAQASIFCLPSHWEAFPLSLLEAMAAEAAPIATRVGDIPRILAEGQAGLLVEPEDSAALAEAIRRLVRSPQERHTLGVAARARVEAEFSQARLVKAINYLYRGMPADEADTTLA